MGIVVNDRRDLSVPDTLISKPECILVASLELDARTYLITGWMSVALPGFSIA